MVAEPLHTRMVLVDAEAVMEGSERVDTLYAHRVQLAQCEHTRTTLALIFAALFAVTLLLAGLGATWSENWENIAEFLQLALPAETALLGSAVGFYFGSNAQTSSQ
jgi:hypothetical protein